MDVIADSNGALTPSLGQHRHFPISHGKGLRRRTLNHRVRLAAKRYQAEHPNELPCRTHGIECRFSNQPDHCRQDRSRTRYHIEQDLYSEVQQHREPDERVRYILANPPGKYRSGASWGLAEDDNVALARSRDPLPSDRFRSLQRTPSLEREDAFCDARTHKGRVHVKQMPIVPADDDAQVADLYRMGLLYDDSDTQKSADSGLNLNDIHHDEPVYSIRPARRARRAKARGYQGPLPLELSFADLGTDNDLAQYLSSSPTAEGTSHGTTGLQHSRRSSQQSAPIRVIYELATSRPSFDVDTSQPPDLMTDSLSDYDCFSDSELDDDTLSQRVVHDAAASGPWVLLGDDS